jgi:Zn-dependent protease with chaperone function
MASETVQVPVSSAKQGKRTRRLSWLALTLLLLATFAIVFIPAWVIQPFKSQTHAGMQLSFVLRRWSPVVTLAFLVVTIALAAWLWRGTSRWWQKTALVLVVLLASAFTWLSRQNHFEWMFNPLPNPSYISAQAASFLKDEDMVLSVENNGDAAAYPVRLMAYHHVVQDIVGGTPVVATY